MDEITKLKAEAYDIIAQREYLTKVLEQKNQRIAELSQKQAEEPKKATAGK